MTIYNLPSLTLLLGVGVLDVVGDDLDLVGFLRCHEVSENGTDDWGHTAGIIHTTSDSESHGEIFRNQD